MRVNRPGAFLRKKPILKVLVCLVTACSSPSDPAKAESGPFGKDLSDPDIPADSLPTLWIKPMRTSGSGPASPLFDTCGMGDAEKGKTWTPVPDGATAFPIVSATNYIASVEVFDKDSVLKAQLNQGFGYCGELANPNRQVPGGYASFLVWDRRDGQGRILGQGVYVWSIALTYGDGTKKRMDPVSIRVR